MCSLTRERVISKVSSRSVHLVACLVVCDTLRRGRCCCSVRAIGRRGRPLLCKRPCRGGTVRSDEGCT